MQRLMTVLPAATLRRRQLMPAEGVKETQKRRKSFDVNNTPPSLSPRLGLVPESRTWQGEIPLTRRHDRAVGA